MLTQAIGGLLAPAVAVALSPIPIVAIVLVLATPRARANGSAFALGWVLGLTAVSTIVVLLTNGAGDSEAATSTVNWVQVALGAGLLVLAARKWRSRPRPGDAPEAPAWMTTLDDLDPGRALLLGVGLSAANPKNLALTVAAAASIAQAGLGTADTVIAVAVFVVVGSVTVVGAVLFHAVGGARAEKPLAALKQFMFDNNAVIMMVILLLFGVKLVGDGLGALGG